MGLTWNKMDHKSRSFLRDVKGRFTVRGLPNYSLSCCINSLLQSFFVTTELQELLSRYDPSKDSERRTVPVQLKKALCAMRDSSNSSPHRDFLDCLHYHHSIHWSAQHDADEIFHSILNLTQKQMPDRELAQEIRKLYEIRVETQVVCDTCKNVFTADSSLFSLPLAVREERNSLETCIRSFSQQQTLMDGEFYCLQCEEKQPSTHALKLLSLPAVLCVQLKRFRNDGGFIRKLNNTVTFLQTLNMNAFDVEQPVNTDEYYSLFAVIVHIGTVSSGHYTAYVRSGPDQKWFHADDSCVHEATWEDVCDTYKGSRTAYLLLYRKMKSE